MVSCKNQAFLGDTSKNPFLILLFLNRLAINKGVFRGALKPGANGKAGFSVSPEFLLEKEM
jgi:hypothetical protein